MAMFLGAITVETPKYTVLQKYATFELRQYEKQIRAEVSYAMDPKSGISDGLNQPFMMLAGYIFGKNTKRGASDQKEEIAMTAPVVTQNQSPEKIAMTAPVITQNEGPEKVAMTAPVVTQQGGSTQRRMAFILPSKYTSIDQLPVPKDSRVTFSEVPAMKAAAITFSWWMTDGAAKKKEAELREACSKEGIQLTTEPTQVQYCQYNPPWTLPFARKNEILIPLAEQS